MKTIYTSVVVLTFLMFAAASSNDDSGQANSSSPYLNVRVALDICKEKLVNDVNTGNYNHLSDYQKSKQMEENVDICMLSYGHSPN